MSANYNARILIVNEIPKLHGSLSHSGFMGTAGQEFHRMLDEAGINEEDCFFTYVHTKTVPYNPEALFCSKKEAKALSLRERFGKYPSEELEASLNRLADEINAVSPNLIIALGDLALWALTGKTSISKWRGSHLTSVGLKHTHQVIPTYNPSAIIRQWELRFISVHDLKTAKACSFRRETPAPELNLIIEPSAEEVYSALKTTITTLHNATSPVRIAGDIETRNRHIVCIGLGFSETEAICIPFTSQLLPNYFSEEEELQIILLLKTILTHPNAYVVWQNGIYDSQYIARRWGFLPKISSDTMIAQHVCFPGLPKGLDFISSMYCEHHVYWKDDSKTWHDSGDETIYWRYNCIDCVRTWEASLVLENALRIYQLQKPYQFCLDLHKPVLKMMLRGVIMDKAHKAVLSLELAEKMIQRQDFLNYVLGHDFNPRSPKQMKALFYSDFQLKPVIQRKTKKPTLDAPALATIRTRCDPVIFPIIDTITEFRSLGVFYSTFVEMNLDMDGRVRCSFKIAGPETFRFASSEDAFGYGTNLQNIPSGNED